LYNVDEVVKHDLNIFLHYTTPGIFSHHFNMVRRNQIIWYI